MNEEEATPATEDRAAELGAAPTADTGGDASTGAPTGGEAASESGADDDISITFEILGVGTMRLTPRQAAAILHETHHAVHEGHREPLARGAPWRGLAAETGLTPEELAEGLDVDPDLLDALADPDPEAGQ